MELSLLNRGLSVWNTGVPASIPVYIGSAQLEWSNDDANANALFITTPEGSGTVATCFVFGDASIRSQDLGWFNGVTEPRVVVVDDDMDSWMGIGHSADDTAAFMTDSGNVFTVANGGLAVTFGGAIYSASANAFTLAATNAAALRFNDDCVLAMGGSFTNDPRITFETADANAHVLMICLGVAQATTVPVAVFGDNSIFNTDLGFFDGVTEPRIAIVDADDDSWCGIGHSADDVAAFMTDSGNVFTVGNGGLDVTFGGHINFGASSLDLCAYDANAAFFEIKARDTDVGLVAVASVRGAADPYFGVGGSNAFKFYYSGYATFGGATFWTSSVDSAAVADEVSFGRYEIGAGNTVIALSQETAVAAEADETKFSNKLQVRINGATYYIMLCTT